MKKLIVSGDSCTDLTFESPVHPTWDYSWPKWPEHLAKHLGMELVCLAKGGQGNQFIYSTLLDEITKTRKDEIGMVIAAWSQCHRKDWEIGHVTGSLNNPYDRKGKLWRSKLVDEDGDLPNWVTKSLRTFLSFQILCERYNLPYYHFQMTSLFEQYLYGPIYNYELIEGKKYMKRKSDGVFVEKKYIIRILQRVSEYGKWINKFIGWPGLEDQFDMAGFNMTQHILGKDHETKIANGTIISEQDIHPNAKGHKLIATFLANYIEEKK